MADRRGPQYVFPDLESLRPAGPLDVDDVDERIAANEIIDGIAIDQRASQARYVVPVFLAAQDPIARKVEACVRRRPANPFTLQDLAQQTGTTTRTLNRRLALATGLSRMRFAQKIRVDAALHLLQTTRLSLEIVAERVGFEDSSAIYRLIRRTPADRRACFGLNGTALRRGCGFPPAG